MARGDWFSPRPGPDEAQRITVAFSYPVVFTRDLFDPANRALIDALATREQKRHRALVVVDSGVAAAWPALGCEIATYATAHADQLTLTGPPVIVDGGERCKNDPAALARLQRLLYEHAIDRHSFLVVIGGGAVLDMAGYAGATAHRGVRVVRVPTTTLAQADSGVGVKCGVNAFGVKNFLGTFAPPFAVLNDVRLLASLSARDRVAGMAEAVKVALVRDGAFFDWIEAHTAALAAGNADAVAELVERSARLHLAHIAGGGDPFEQGSARPLDFGHWAAHKLESLTQHRLRHGEAVSIGMAIDARQSHAAGLLDEVSLRRVLGVLATLGLPTWDPALDAREDGRRVVVDGLREFREHLGGELCITLLAAIGRGVEVGEAPEARVEAAIAGLLPRAADHGIRFAAPAALSA